MNFEVRPLMSTIHLKPILRCVIIDDDPTAIIILENYLSNLPEPVVVTSFADPMEAMMAAENIGKIDFLFLDILMPISGIDVARKLRDYTDFLIFTTAYPDYALDAFSVGADHYLVKPFDFSTIQSSIYNVLARAALLSEK